MRKSRCQLPADRCCAPPHPLRDVLSSMVRAWERERALPEGKRARRRSEIDRRLESLVPAGVLRASNPTAVIRVCIPLSTPAREGAGERVSPLAPTTLAPLYPWHLGVAFHPALYHTLAPSCRIAERLRDPSDP